MTLRCFIQASKGEISHHDRTSGRCGTDAALLCLKIGAASAKLEGKFLCGVILGNDSANHRKVSGDFVARWKNGKISGTLAN